MHKTKEKGDLGLVFALAFATEQGWNCSVPLSEHQPYDFIAEKNGDCKRVQVRYTTPKNGVMEVKLKSVWADKNGNHVTLRKKGDFDILAIYNPDNKIVYFVNDDDFSNSTAITLRIEKPMKNYKSIRMAENYLLI